MGEMAAFDGSLVIEWDNPRLAGGGRARRMMESLSRQLGEVATRWEVIVCGSPEVLTGELMEEIGEVLGEWGGRVDLRFVPAPAAVTETGAAPYFELKNYGAAQASGELLVFLDSDVVPEEGWLRALAGTFDDPAVEVATGAVHLEGEGLYADAVAMFWFFAPRREGGGVEETRHFFANNVAFRRELFERFPFPSLAGTNRGACRRLAATLREHGVRIYLNRAARVSHPPPATYRHFAMRALSHGRDNYVSEGAMRTLGRFVAGLGEAAWRPVARFRGLGVPAVEVPAGWALGAAYWGLHLAGFVIAAVHPRFARAHIRL